MNVKDRAWQWRLQKAGSIVTRRKSDDDNYAEQNRHATEENAQQGASPAYEHVGEEEPSASLMRQSPN
jgi:hypothetical protein